MQCSSCGETIPDNAKFCPQCGHVIPQIALRPLQSISNVCSFSSRPSHYVCESCGKRLCRDHVLHAETVKREFTGYSLGNIPLYENQVEDRYKCSRCSSREAWKWLALVTPLAIFGLAFSKWAYSDAFVLPAAVILILLIEAVAVIVTAVEYSRWNHL
jgi:hypothetical protein